ncbi:hypothetical protein BDP81DRAFT_443104 [Colletotrichum phormii]|uniref:Uncharacterized protein n=1 Tax=Colletotrichum phormii TaxID=359342 RepID=A0AAI9ZC35_9PEZI|nr:uncharacterized protein BDP81DRAFT_443104 [Colletotrichum phormii]KAK1621686.1 hypothetical protein BDP81DRAFT_443104 [Colletotrichum phormii]
MFAARPSSFRGWLLRARRFGAAATLFPGSENRCRRCLILTCPFQITNKYPRMPRPRLLVNLHESPQLVMRSLSLDCTLRYQGEGSRPQAESLDHRQSGPFEPRRMVNRRNDSRPAALTGPFKRLSPEMHCRSRTLEKKGKIREVWEKRASSEGADWIGARVRRSVSWIKRDGRSSSYGKDK